MLLFVLFAVIFTVYGAEDENCGPHTQASVLRCAGSLVDYSVTRAHPTLQGNDATCSRYADYKICTQKVSAFCRQNVAGFVENAYDVVCDAQFVSLAVRNLACFVEIEKDVESRKCHEIVVSDEKSDVSDVGKNVTEMEEEQESPANFTGPPFCQKYQKYLDCIAARHWKKCQKAVEQIGDFLKKFLPDCQPQTKEPIIDVDECKVDAMCSQRCLNSMGSYKCLCDERYYRLGPDQKSCVPHKDSPLWIFFAHGQSIWNISVAGDFQLQRAALQKVAMIELDYEEEMLYYADIGANRLERISFNEAFPEVIQSYEVEGTEGIAIDWISRNLYMVRQRDMSVQQLDGRFRKTLYRDVMSLPRALVLHPFTGYAYVTDWSAQAFIGKAAMDGSSFQRIITQSIVWPNGLAVDYYSDTLYWADAFLDTIDVGELIHLPQMHLKEQRSYELSHSPSVWPNGLAVDHYSDPLYWADAFFDNIGSSDLSGGHRRTVISGTDSVPHVFGLAVEGDYIYWTDWTFRGILRAHKSTGNNVTLLAQTALLPYGLKIFHPAMQPIGSNECSRNRSKCSQMCLTRPIKVENRTSTTGVCACANGFRLDEDGSTCVSNCTDKEIQCGGLDPRCISKRYYCDGKVECQNRADEQDCPQRRCLTGEFQCHDGSDCLITAHVCDSVQHCNDNSDEAYC